MQTTWDLSVFYSGFEDPSFSRDLADLPRLIDRFQAALREDAPLDAQGLRGLLSAMESIETLHERLRMMIELTLSCDAENPQANAALAPLMQAGLAYEQAQSAFCRRLAAENWESLLCEDEALKKNAFFLRESADRADHLLDPALEEPVLRMQLSGGTAFAQLRDKLEATLLVNWRGGQQPLSAIRAMAYEPDADTRRAAYEAELAAYAKIELPMAACLNSIKAEGQTLARLKGYKDVLEMTLSDSRMDRQTLDAMWSAIHDALPELRGYLKTKARLLGHQNGLPFYDLFAPVGLSARTYTLEEARALLLDVFGTFCPEMGAMMAQAFDEGWIDAYPHSGKAGGAFCDGSYALNISRILTNFTGSLSDVSTLAHELGHAFNNRMLRRVPRMMTSTPMPLAETASTFNETLLSAVLREGASREEELMLLDVSLSDSIQILVDIESRFLFEQKVVQAQEDHPLSVSELKDAMLWAQGQTYGDGLDPALRHPYMWACKGHYYSTHTHFYNFPYAFGGLFARGLYARYRREGAAFVPTYCDLLSRFGSGPIADLTASVGIDVHSAAFWREAVQSIASEAQRFAELAK